MNIRDQLVTLLKSIRDRYIFRFFWLSKQKSSRIPLSKTILVIRLDAIGDSIIWLDQAKEYRKAFPTHRLVLFHNAVWGKIANQLPWFDECIPFYRERIGNIKYYRKLLTILNKYTYEKIFSPVFSRDFITVDWLIHNINALEKIGYTGDYQNNFVISINNLYYRHHQNEQKLKAIADSWYTYLVPNSQECVMELQRNAHFIRQTLNANYQCQLPRIPFEISSSKRLPQEDYAVLFLGASTEKRMWPIDRFIQITHHIPFQTIVLCGSSAEKRLSQSFISYYRDNKKIVDLTGETSLLEFIGIIKNASLVISNETSASHIAVATRTPSICLLGGGHYGRFHPYRTDLLSDEDNLSIPFVVTCSDHSCFGCNWNCKHPYIEGRWRCIANIKTEDVINAINQCLSKNEKTV